MGGLSVGGRRVIIRTRYPVEIDCDPDERLDQDLGGDCVEESSHQSGQPGVTSWTGIDHSLRMAPTANT